MWFSKIIKESTKDKIRYKLKLFVIFFVILFIHLVSAVPAPQDIFNFTQPNYNKFQGRIFGDEWANHAETLEGYTIIRNSYDDYWTYALKKTLVMLN